MDGTTTTIVSAAITALGGITSGWIARKTPKRTGATTARRAKNRAVVAWAFTAGFALATALLVVLLILHVVTTAAQATPAGATRLVDSDETLTVTPANLAAFEQRVQVGAGHLVFDGVEVAVPRQALYMANTIELLHGAVLSGPEFAVITGALRGGVLRANGPDGSGASAPGQGNADGQAGGRLLVAAGSIVGTRLEAKGGSGSPGAGGAAGAAGAMGSDGTDGRCGPGILGQFRGSTQGGDGRPGGAGGNGGQGGDGGSGGVIYLLSSGEVPAALSVAGGLPGAGGPAGEGGPGGPGGSGGSGCSGAGGHQPTRANGHAGLRGPDGKPGLAGSAGAAGETWIQRKVSLDEVRRILKSAPTTEEGLHELIRLARS